MCELNRPPPIPQIKPRTSSTPSSHVLPIPPSPQGILIISMDEPTRSNTSSGINSNSKGKKIEEIEEVRKSLNIVWIAESLSEEKKSGVDLSLVSIASFLCLS